MNNNHSTESIAFVHAVALVPANDVFDRMRSVFPIHPNPMRPLLATSESAATDSERGPPMPRTLGAPVAEY